MGFPVENRYLTISLRESKGNGATCLWKMFSEKRRNVNGLKTLDKEIDNTGTISRLHVLWPSEGPTCTSVTDCTEVKDVLVHRTVCLCESVLWLSFLAKCKAFDVVKVGRHKYLSSAVNPIDRKQTYRTSELCHR